MRTLGLDTSTLTRRERARVLSEQRKVRRLARTIQNEEHLRRILSECRDGAMRRQVFMLIVPWLGFELGEELKLEARAAAMVPGGIGG